jgi:hypothetical protein
MKSASLLPLIFLNPIISRGFVKIAQNTRFSGRHGDLPLRKPVGATHCGRLYLRNSALTLITKFGTISLESFGEKEIHER